MSSGNRAMGARIKERKASVKSSVRNGSMMVPRAHLPQDRRCIHCGLKKFAEVRPTALREPPTTNCHPTSAIQKYRPSRSNAASPTVAEIRRWSLEFEDAMRSIREFCFQARRNRQIDRTIFYFPFREFESARPDRIGFLFDLKIDR